MLISFIKDAPALLIKKEGTLVVGDLHIGLNLRFRESGIHFQHATERMAKRLLEIYKKSGAENIVLLGDVKESIASPSFSGYHELKLFFDSLNGIRIRVVKGNHDGDLQMVLRNMGLSIQVEREIFVGDVALMHGNSWPSEGAMRERYIVVGHGHYAMRKQERVEKIWLDSKISKKAGKKYEHYNRNARLIVVPSFNELVIGSALSKKTKEYLPVFKNDVFSFEDTRVYNLERKFEGRVSEIIRRG